MFHREQQRKFQSIINGMPDPSHRSGHAVLQIRDNVQLKMESVDICAACRVGDPQGAVCVQERGIPNPVRYLLRHVKVSANFTISGKAVEMNTRMEQCPARRAFYAFRDEADKIASSVD